MKVAFIKRKFSFYGGAEQYLRKVMINLAERHEIHLLTSLWEESTAFKIHKISSLGIAPDFIFAQRVKQYLKTHPFDVVVSFERTYSQDIYRASDGCHKKWLEQRKFIDGYLKCLSFRFNPHHLIILFLEKKALKTSKKIITLSQMDKRAFKTFYGEEIAKKCTVCYNGVDLKRFFPPSLKKRQEFRGQLGLEDKKVLLLVGSGFKRKGLLFVLDVLKCLPKEFVLLVVGKGKIGKKLLRGLEKRIYFLGPQRKIERFYQLADIFILPTIYDPFGNAILEAMACGLPVITTNASGASEIIENGKEGFILNFPVNLEEFAYCLEIASKNQKIMGKNAYEKAKLFSLEKAVNEFLEVIER